MEKQIIELFTPLKVKINEKPINFKNIIISNTKYTYVYNEMLNKIVFELMNILDDILNKIKDKNVFYITTKDNVETYLYYNNKKIEFNNDYFVKRSSLYLEYKNKWFGIKVILMLILI
tara:strand:- start:624 stop:977 length:354 start_codon:yes stop_codon:yes gene_type:complete